MKDPVKVVDVFNSFFLSIVKI